MSVSKILLLSTVKQAEEATDKKDAVVDLPVPYLLHKTIVINNLFKSILNVFTSVPENNICL
jgi:hypothetical protein